MYEYIVYSSLVAVPVASIQPKPSKGAFMTPHNNMQVEGYLHAATSTVSYIVFDRETKQCALIDSVPDYDPI